MRPVTISAQRTIQLAGCIIAGFAIVWCFFCLVTLFTHGFPTKPGGGAFVRGLCGMLTGAGIVVGTIVGLVWLYAANPSVTLGRKPDAIPQAKALK